MGLKTLIGWTASVAKDGSIKAGATWNPWGGCKKVSRGCKFCYAERQFHQYKKSFSTVKRQKSFRDPLKWKNWINRKETIYQGLKIFTCSTSDFFIDVADPWRPEAWEIIKETPEFEYLILTKRPERIQFCLPRDWGPKGYPNVTIGFSAEGQKELNERIWHLDTFEAKNKFISFEPLLEPIDLFDSEILEYFTEVDLNHGLFNDPNMIANSNQVTRRRKFNSVGLDWGIIGGESGNLKGKSRFRDCRVGWIRDLSNQLIDLEIPVFVKQFGTHIARLEKAAGNNIGSKGEDFSNLPIHLKNLNLHQFPKF